MSKKILDFVFEITDAQKEKPWTANCNIIKS